MERIWIRRAKNFEEAVIFEREYYAAMTPEERLDSMQRLREAYFKFNKDTADHAGTFRLQKHVKILCFVRDFARKKRRLWRNYQVITPLGTLASLPAGIPS